MQKDISTLTPEESLREAHLAIERLESTIKRIEAIVGERRASPLIHQIRSIWFVIIFLSFVNVVVLSGVSVVHGMNLQNYHTIDKNTAVFQQDLKQINKDLEELRSRIKELRIPHSAQSS